MLYWVRLKNNHTRPACGAVAHKSIQQYAQLLSDVEWRNMLELLFCFVEVEEVVDEFCGSTIKKMFFCCVVFVLKLKIEKGALPCIK